MTTYNLHLWKSASWKKETRYYNCQLQQNLFGDWIIVRSWGAQSSKRGRTMEQVCDSYTSACSAFQGVAKRRIAREYQLVTKQEY
ncbi:WGR domain [Hyella patelloides LEGE 07179]|uniref:WGR domain n=1 Tax=Hyella patelloides LEGE 07179 TaxID=945734 RepID=A0A563W248_9CYAN|nr:WGR domain-containing protein [Hyella patelloides]VEP17779.1 WGR domain [Hyella patelloides LEGE 07179]